MSYMHSGRISVSYRYPEEKKAERTMSEDKKSYRIGYANEVDRSLAERADASREWREKIAEEMAMHWWVCEKKELIAIKNTWMSKKCCGNPKDHVPDGIACWKYI